MRVESLRAPCLDASSTLATSTSKRAIFRSFFVSAARSVNRWRCGRVVCKLRDSHCCCATANLNRKSATQTSLVSAFQLIFKTFGFNAYLSSFALLKPAEVVRLSVVYFRLILLSFCRSFSFRRLGRSTCGGVAELSAIYGVGELLRNLEIASDK